MEINLPVLHKMLSGSSSLKMGIRRKPITQKRIRFSYRFYENAEVK